MYSVLYLDLGRVNILKLFHFPLAKKGTGADPKYRLLNLKSAPAPTKKQTSAPVGSGSATLRQNGETKSQL